MELHLLTNIQLSDFRSRFFSVITKLTRRATQTRFDLIFNSNIPRAEVSMATGISDNNLYQNLLRNRAKITQGCTVGLNRQALGQYTGASRIINLLARECHRKGGIEGQPSYEELFQNVDDISRNNLTVRQKEIYDMFFSFGYSQQSIAESLEIVQPSVQKQIYGNFDYCYNKYYGGIISKIGKGLRSRNVPYCCQIINPYGAMLKYVFD